MRMALSRQPLVASVKTALAWRYRDDAWKRLAPPLQPLSDTQVRSLQDALKETP